MTTLSVSGSAAIIYSKETFPGLSTITAPATIQTSVVETKTDGSSSTFIGGIVVGPGGVYWGTSDNVLFHVEDLEAGFLKHVFRTISRTRLLGSSNVYPNIY